MRLTIDSCYCLVDTKNTYASMFRLRIVCDFARFEADRFLHPEGA